MGQRAVDEAIFRGITDFVNFTTTPAPHRIYKTPDLSEVKQYLQADGTTSEVPGEIPPPIPQEAIDAAKAEAAKEAPKSTRKPRTSKPKADVPAPTAASEDEWETVASPYEKSEEPAEGNGGKVAEVKAEVKTGKTTPHIKYDKAIPEHRSTLAAYLTATHPTWRNEEHAATRTTLTNDLIGQDFLDSKGNIVETFKDLIATYF
jgi:hypothetical protein